MPDLSSLYKPGPYHILAYGTLLGTNLFQTFIGGITAYRALPRAQFSSLQKALFPIYFSIQTALPVVLALTYPVSHTSLGDKSSLSTTIDGILSTENGYSVLLPLSVMFLGGLVNLVAVGPATTKVMVQRKHQETRDGKKYFDPGPHSDAMKKLNTRFATAHGISSILNLGAVVACIAYGVVLGDRLA